MSDKFLNTGGSGNANISNGTINAFVAGITVANLKASMPIKTNSVNTLVSTKLDISDINNLEGRLDSIISQPFVGDFKATDFETDDYFSINTELQKVDNFTASTATDTNITGIVKVPEVATGRIYDSTQATFIDLDGIDVAVDATDLTLNGFSVISEVGNKNLVNTLTTSQTAFTLDQELITKNYVDVATSGIAELETKTQNTSNTTTAGNTIRTGDQQFLLGDSLTGDSLSITGGAVGDPLFTRIMDMSGLGINTVAPLNTGVIRPDTDIIRDIGTTALRYKDIYSVSSISDYSVNNITTKPPNTVSVGKTYVNSTSESLVYVYDNEEYPIAGNRVKKVFKGSSNVGATVYEDDNMLFYWDAVNYQPKFILKTLPSGNWVDGGMTLSTRRVLVVGNPAVPITVVSVGFISPNYDNYFSQSGNFDAEYNAGDYGSYFRTWLIAENTSNYPSYSCQWMMGAPGGNLNVITERY